MKSKLDPWRRQEVTEIDLRRWFSLQWHRAVVWSEGFRRTSLRKLGKRLWKDLRETLHSMRRKIMARPQEQFEVQEGKATYQDVIDAPENMVAELIDGMLHLMSRPSPAHGKACTRLGTLLDLSFAMGINGPGGWHIMAEPELHLIRDTRVLVPDLAGWKLETMPEFPESHRDAAMPDWVCEILSPSTGKVDVEVKMPLYAQAGIGHLWFIDPIAKTLQAFELRKGKWAQIADLKDADTVSVSPFDAIDFDLSELWLR